MIGAAMTGVRWTYALTRVPSRVFDRLNTWAWWAFDDTGKPMPKKARRAAGAATLILGVAAVGASAMHWVEPQRAAILWGWFSILAIAGSAFQASRRLSRATRPRVADPNAPTAEAAFWTRMKCRARAMPGQACRGIGAGASKTYARVRRSAPGQAAKAWAFACRAGKATGRTVARAATRGPRAASAGSEPERA